MFNVYKNQLSRQTGSRNLTGPKTLPTIWYTYMTLVTKYQISAVNSYWEKCAKKYLGRTEGRTEVKQYTPPPPLGSGGIIIFICCFLLVPGQASQESLLVRQILCTSRVWQFHTPGLTPTQQFFSYIMARTS
jgi:hypothetical protein